MLSTLILVFLCAVVLSAIAILCTLVYKLIRRILVK